MATFEYLTHLAFSLMRLLAIVAFILLHISVDCQKQWTIMNPMPDEAEGRHHPVTFSYDVYGYVMGGSGADGDLKDMYKYDSRDETWTQIESFPGVARGYSIGGVAGDKAYTGFGRGQLPGEPVTYYDDLWEFDPVSEEWKQLASCPCDGRGHPAFVTTDTKIFVGLGNSQLGNYKDWWEYDIASDSWSQKPDFPTARRHHPYFFEIDGLVYVAFGHGDIIYKDLHVYDPATEEWTFLGFLPGEARVAGTQFAYNGKGYVLSGDGDTHENLPQGELWEYDPETNEWTKLTSHPGPGRWAPGSFLIDDTIYFTGGDYIILYSDLLAFDLSEDEVSTTDTEASSFNIFPNPSEGIFTVEHDGVITELSIYRMDGILVETIQQVANNRLDLSYLEAGSYVLKLIDSDKNEARQVLLISK